MAKDPIPFRPQRANMPDRFDYGGLEPSFQEPQRGPQSFDPASMGIDQGSFAWLNMLGRSPVTEWTPTITAEANCTVTPRATMFLDLGAYVLAGGRIDIDPTLTATQTQFKMSLPVQSVLGAVQYLTGMAFSEDVAGMGAAIRGDPTTNTAVFDFIASDVTSQAWSFFFFYLKNSP